MQNECFSVDKCNEIDESKANKFFDKKAPRSGFNIGFELNFWTKWCKLLGRQPSKPVEEATDLMNSDDNFMKKHSKLSYKKGHVWFFLKAQTEEDSEALLQVSYCRVENTIS